MKKKYEIPSLENPEAGEPAVPYIVEKTNELLYDIPEEYLLQQIAKAEKDIAEGRLTTHEEMKNRFLK